MIARLNAWRPPWSDTRRGRWGRAALAILALLAVTAAVLPFVNTPVRTPVGARGVGKGSFPVVEIAGLESTGAGFARLTRALQQQGTTVLDFNPSRPGSQPLTYQPTSGSQHIADLATTVVVPAIRAALTRAGLDPDTQQVDVVAHSMGGLLARCLVEQLDWAPRVDDLVMVGTPNHDSTVVSLETGGDPFVGLGDDMAPGSAFLRRMGTAEPAGEVYTTIGGDPWVFRWLRYGHHGFDDAVPAESPFLTGAATDTFGYLHGKLVPAQPVIDLVVNTLAAR